MFVACNDDNPKKDGKNSTIVGVWVSEKMSLTDEIGNWVIGHVVAYMWHQQDGKIDEDLFMPLFPEGKKSGRPNAPVCILVAMSIIRKLWRTPRESPGRQLRTHMLTVRNTVPKTGSLQRTMVKCNSRPERCREVTGGCSPHTMWTALPLLTRETELYVRLSKQ